MTNRTAIVCDDDWTLLKIVQFVLVKKSFEVRIADHGDKALELLKEALPTILLLDLEMPEKDGFSVLKEIQQNFKVKPYIIVLSSHEGKEIHDKVSSLGANEIWVKPFNTAELLKRVEGLIDGGKV